MSNRIFYRLSQRSVLSSEMAESAAKRLLKDLKHIQVWRQRMMFYLSRGRILGRKPDKSLKRFPPCYSLSPLQLRLWISISWNSRNSFTVQLLYTYKEKIGKPDWKPYLLPDDLRKPYRNLKIIPRNLNIILRSWIRLPANKKIFVICNYSIFRMIRLLE